MLVNGGKTMTSGAHAHPQAPSQFDLMSAMSWAPSLAVMFIFQLPAITFLRSMI